jgi:chitinase C1|nr:MAG TPA: hypothetical protein [Caudoviricetes sp.]
MTYAVVTISWMLKHGLHPTQEMRKSADGNYVIVHGEFLEPFDDGEQFTRYYHNDPKFIELLQSEAWSPSEETPVDTNFNMLLSIQNSMILEKEKINTYSLTDSQALALMSLYPRWEEYIGQSLVKGTKIQYGDKLYNARQNIAKVLENQPPSINTAALYEEINESAAGTIDDPIPYDNNMELVEGKYYIQDGVKYKCIRSTGQAIYNPLSTLVSIYVELA